MNRCVSSNCVAILVTSKSISDFVAQIGQSERNLSLQAYMLVTPLGNVSGYSKVNPELQKIITFMSYFASYVIIILLSHSIYFQQPYINTRQRNLLLFDFLQRKGQHR